eukprot:TRINITY_DN4258_c0_g3_i2.p1 TRINITY_DN4258_c0_g3~~TRINITY_DN4258_c0_g3_i2.p1  ORF type:complete len:546 (+),score=77.48 TRINITY_DN4258_c0_g3_i2:73-1710(+)
MDSISNSSSEQVIDRISSLPDALLLHILSFLDVCQAIRSGILSSRWRVLWTSISSLDFNQYQFKGYKGFDPLDDLEEEGDPYQRHNLLYNEFDYDEDDDDDDNDDGGDADGGDSASDNADEFIKFVERSLLLHGAPKINKFSLTCDYRKKLEYFIDGWILAATRKDVKEFYLEFPYSIDDSYSLPCWLLKCGSLISLSLDGCLVGVPKSVYLSSLLSLSLYSIRMEVGSIPALLSGCPMLEELVLDKCSISSGRLRILPSSSSTALRLKRLKVVFCSNQSGNEIGLEVEAPNLEFLSLFGVKIHKNPLRNMLFLREAHLGIYFTGWNHKLHCTLESWLKDLKHVKVLGLCSSCIEVLSFFGERYQPSYCSKTKCLVLESELQRSELPGIANLLWRSHDLENLIINLPTRMISGPSQTPEEEDFINEYWRRLKFSFPCMVNSLMTVKISGFMGRKCKSAQIMLRKCRSTVDCDIVSSIFEKQDTEIELVRFFLTNAVSLKKMTVQFCDKPDFLEGQEWSKILLRTSQKLTAIPRTSSCAELSLLKK